MRDGELNHIDDGERTRVEELAGTSGLCSGTGNAMPTASLDAVPESSGDASQAEEPASQQEEATQQDDAAAVAAAARIALALEEDLQFESGCISFPEKLMTLLNGSDVKDSMWWLPDGDAFCLAPANFDDVLDKYFQGTKLESFTRKLNRW